MGAWIEICSCWGSIKCVWSHPTMGAWIEIDVTQRLNFLALGRTPRWVRGLKFLMRLLALSHHYVAPHDGCVD